MDTLTLLAIYNYILDTNNWCNIPYSKKLSIKIWQLTSLHRKTKIFLKNCEVILRLWIWAISTTFYLAKLMLKADLFLSSFQRKLFQMSIQFIENYLERFSKFHSFFWNTFYFLESGMMWEKMLAFDWTWKHPGYIGINKANDFLSHIYLPVTEMLICKVKNWMIDWLLFNFQ